MDAWDSLLLVVFVAFPALAWAALVGAIMGVGRLRGRQISFGAANVWVFAGVTGLCILGLIVA
ncbi:hypothetical protein [Paramagnetospirillum magneticum]|uniref:Uncharacterized protein n=1 Tax=Paramagnetospirillum magneticum (strain ATCC 700264 / AMB-1) TaxID=342108 RepID=Q2W267_PARM1|nr:hypothetical protein [Paramagnetospirillum magneticum]BAE52058.1 hypothetical protein amb3254 [Paramagnetospirillum magneticum AMB-1]